MTPDELMQEMNRIALTGDESALKTFVLENLKNMPDDMKGKFLLALYTDSLEQDVSEARITKLQEQGADLLDHLATLKESADGATA